jgi:hypothetical protein
MQQPLDAGHVCTIVFQILMITGKLQIIVNRKCPTINKSGCCLATRTGLLAQIKEQEYSSKRPDHTSVPIQPEGYVPSDDTLDAAASSP